MSEPVNDWLETLLPTKPAAVAKIDDFVEEHLNNRNADDPPREFPITSQVEGGLRELGSDSRIPGTAFCIGGPAPPCPPPRV